MTGQLILGTALAVVANLGLAGLYVAGAIMGFTVPGEAVAPLFAIGQLGMMFVGKERLPQSAEAFKKFSTRPPRPPSVAPVALLALVAGCGGSMPSPDYADLRVRANELRDDVNVIADAVTASGPYVSLGCDHFGAETAECKSLVAAYETARTIVDAASAAIDFYEATGVRAEDAERLIDTLQDAANQLADKVVATKAVLHEALAGSDRGGESGESAAPEKEAEAEAAAAQASDPAAATAP